MATHASSLGNRTSERYRAPVIRIVIASITIIIIYADDSLCLTVRAKIKVNGIVQGVGFRPFVYRIASRLGLKGYVLNLGDAGVEIEVEGEKRLIEQFLILLREQSPPLSIIDELQVHYDGDKQYHTFEIRKSRMEKRRGTSVIPPDIAICDECIGDMEREGRRHNYFFTTCTNCGPRFTIIERLPYDRCNTTMKPFDMCDDCHEEYTNPLDRRYHAQTIACTNCGPRVFLQQKKGTLEGEGAVWTAADLLLSGAILALKGVGGYHLSCVAEGDAVARLRRLLGRPSKPFAIMAKDMSMVEEIAVVGSEEKNLLESSIRPIVLLEKRQELPGVAPGLHNYGVMLPYTGLHVMLFKKIDRPLVMTSANLPGRPIMHTEQEISHIGADAILFYDREIHQRCDDSIMRVVGGEPLLIRRSRGFVPMAIEVTRPAAHIMALGAEENVTACLLTGRHAFLTQYVGHVQAPETREFLQQALAHMTALTDFTPEAMACDMHPHFFTTQHAQELAASRTIPLVQVQHHHAHIAAVMAEYGLQEAVGIAMDGFGYGDDGHAWGGEVMYATLSSYERLAHLQYHSLPGGDLATRYPLRMLAGILGDGAGEFLMERAHAFPHGEREAEVVLKMSKHAGLQTSSCGRLLDAVAAMLDLCHVMHYEGEPAMRLESLAKRGKNILELEPSVAHGVIETKTMVQHLFEHMGKERKEDLAYSAEEYVARALAEAALVNAENLGISSVAVAGGCAYNEHITMRIKEMVSQAGMQFYISRKVPCGDGGVSFGQAVVASEKMKE